MLSGRLFRRSQAIWNRFRWVNFLVFDFGELGVVGIRCNSFIWLGANQRYWLGASYSAGLRYPLRLQMRRPFWFCA
jgi:hypothetical protein